VSDFALHEAHKVQLLLNSSGVTHMCLDLIADGIHDDLKFEAIKLLATMLQHEGGNIVVQQTIFDLHDQKDSSAFFIEIRHMFDGLIEWHDAHPRGIKDNEIDGCLPCTFIVVPLLRTMCEGHFEPMQNTLRTQKYIDDSGQVTVLKTPNSVSENILAAIVEYLNVVSRIPFRVSSKAIIELSELLLKVLQGPCIANQLFLTNETDLLEILNRCLRLHKKNDQLLVEEKKMKYLVIKIFQALLEGHKCDKEHFRKIANVVHLDVLVSHVELPVLREFTAVGGNNLTKDATLSSLEKRLSAESIAKWFVSGKDPTESDSGNRGISCAELLEIWKYRLLTIRATLRAVIAGSNDPQYRRRSQALALQEQKDVLQIQILILLRMFLDSNPNLLNEHAVLHRLKDMLATEICSVEIVWRNNLQRRYFHIPQQLHNIIGKATRKKILSAIDIASEENKLVDFMQRVHEVYLELTWQEYLAHLGINHLLTREIQNRATWLSFSLALAINIIFLLDYSYQPHENCRGRSPRSLDLIYISADRSWNKWGGDDAKAAFYREASYVMAEIRVKDSFLIFIFSLTVL
jgi:hypothetical protein